MELGSVDAPESAAGLNFGAALALGFAVAFFGALCLSFAMSLPLRGLLGDFVLDKGHCESDGAVYFGADAALNLAPCAQIWKFAGSSVLTDLAPDCDRPDFLMLFVEEPAGTGPAPLIDGRWAEECGEDGFPLCCGGDRRSAYGPDVEVLYLYLERPLVMKLGLMEV